ncbi:MAG: hypothetical protein WCP18_03850 [bacterium]
MEMSMPTSISSPKPTNPKDSNPKPVRIRPTYGREISDERVAAALAKLATLKKQKQNQ